MRMSHRKVYSQGNIPFSWEDSPGISKAIHQNCPLDEGFDALKLSSSSAPPPPPSPHPFDTRNIPLPPCQTTQPARRSISEKISLGWWQDDPFLAAYKECTKNDRNGKLPNENKKNVIKHKARKSKLLIFSCRKSCDVRDDNFVKLSNLPPIPRHERKMKIYVG